MIPGATKNQQVGGGEPIYPKRNNYARALSPYNHIYMEIDNTLVPENSQHAPQTAQEMGPPPPLPPLPVYEPLSETYMMSTLSDMSEGDYQLRSGLNSDVSRQSSHRENRPLITRNNFHQSYHPGQAANQNSRNLLQTISGVLHSSQSVRLANTTEGQINRAATLHHRVGNNPRTVLAPAAQVIQWPDGTRTLTRVQQAPQPGQFVLEQMVPGQIQTPVHSQTVTTVGMPMVSSAATAVHMTSSVQPQFAHPVQSNNANVVSATTHPANI